MAKRAKKRTSKQSAARRSRQAQKTLNDLFLDTLVNAARSAAAVEPPHERGWLDREIDRQLLQVRGAEPFKSSPPGDFLEAVESLRAFARERPARVVAEVARARSARTESLRLVW